MRRASPLKLGKPLVFQLGHIRNVPPLHSKANPTLRLAMRHLVLLQAPPKKYGRPGKRQADHLA